MTIFGLTVSEFVTLTNWIGITLAGVVGCVAVLWGRRRKPGDVEIAGGIVDNGAIKLLAAAIEAATLEAIESRKDREKGRALGYRAVELADRLKDEIEELRGEMRRLGDVLARRR